MGSSKFYLITQLSRLGGKFQFLASNQCCNTATMHLENTTHNNAEFVIEPNPSTSGCICMEVT